MSDLPPAIEELRVRAREVAERHVRPVAAKHDQDGEYPHEVMEAVGEADLHGVWIPKEFGGKGLGVLGACVVVEELSRACGGVGVAYSVNALGSFPILLSGTEAQKNRWLPDIAAGRKYVAFALSEKDAGSDPSGMTARAVRDGDDYVLDGDKKWTTNAGVASIFTCFALTDPEKRTKGISAIVVERDTPGFTIGKREDTMGIRCVPIHETHFKDCRVPMANRLGEENGGFKVAMMTLDHARPGVAAQACGVAQGAIDLAVDFTSKRKQFGQPVAKFQGIQWMLADMATQVEAARQLIRTAARAVDAKGPGSTKLTAMAKLFATDTAMRVTTDAVQLFGGYGYVRDFPIEKYMRDAKITQIYEGTNQIQRIVIAREVFREAEKAAQAT